MEEIEYLYSLSRFGVKLGLDIMSEFTERIGNPHLNYRIAHITGTNGKGSTSAMLYTIIKSKYGAGLYTSPHIKRFNERIIVNDEEIDDNFIMEFIRKNRPIIESMGKENKQPTFFEVTTAMAFDYFKYKKVDAAVLEVGMGGRLDATNIVMPDVTGITTISLEHTDKLGNTLSAIAKEKGGIIKEKVPVVVGESKEEPYSVLKRIAEEKHAPFYPIERMYEIKDFHMDLNGTKFRAVGENKDYDVKIPLIGKYQVKNALVAITMAELFDESLDYRAIENVKFNGRFQVRSWKPLIIVDAAHNPEAAEGLVETIEYIFNNKPLIVATQLKDKNSIEFFRVISKITDHIIVTQVKDERAKSAKLLGGEAMKFIKNVDVFERSEDAFKRAIEISDFIVVTGSLYLLGEFEQWFTKMQ